MRTLAQTLDKRIAVRAFFLNISGVPLWLVFLTLLHQRILPSLFWTALIFFVVNFILLVLAYAVWVNPLMEEALRSLPSDDLRGATDSTKYDY